MNTLLCCLPDKLVVDLLYRWLEVANVGRLDSAVCNHDLRPQFLRIAFERNDAVIQYAFFSSPQKKSRRFLDASTRWVLKRGVALRVLTISDELIRACQDGRWLAYAKGDAVREIRVNIGRTEVKTPLTLLCQSCPNVTIAECPIVVDNAISGLIVNSWPNLTTLIVGAITGADLLYLGKSCKSLICLSITREAVVTMEEWEEFFRNCSPDFECVRACAAFTATVFSVIARYCARMLEIDVHPRHYNDAILTELSRCCPLLHRINLSGSDTGVSDIGLTAISRAGHLTALLIGDCIGITAKGIQVAIKNCPGLREIDISGCLQLSDRILKVVGQNCAQLQILRLNGLEKWDSCSSVVNGFKAIVQGCPLLRELYGDSCGALAMALPVLAQGLPNLLLLHARQVEFSIEDLLAFAQSHPSLGELIIGGPEMSSGHVPALLVGCAKLQVLEVEQVQYV